MGAGLVILISAASLFAIRLGGLYFDHWVVQEIFDDWESDPQTAGQNARDLRREFTTRMRVNSLEDAVPRDGLTFERNGQQWLVQADYERRVNLYSNIDLVVRFTDSATLGTP